MSSAIAVIVVAAGSGTRLGHAEPKAFVPLGSGTVLSVAVDSVLGMRETPHLVLVVPGDRVESTRSLFAPVAARAAAAIDVVAGGRTRQESVASGLAELPASVDTVLVHDAARALAPALLFDEVAGAVRARRRGIVPALDVVDTVKRVSVDGRVLETVDRSTLRAVQTPQGFPRSSLDHAYATAHGEFTDDAALVASAGLIVDVVPGDVRAFKITVPADLHRAEQLAAERAAAATPAASAPRIGTGTDVHAFADDDGAPLWLAGLEWPGERGLSGHSDGDAAAHAICDALLAAAGLGDVGQVFGTADARFAGAHGEVFLAETRRLVEAAGWRVGNVTVQIVGNRPKLAPRRAEAEALLSRVLDAPVSVAATTSDALGFTGRGEGVAAIATAMLLPRG
ncbi:2-C-methyl-D-erythritol 2,4-cyclodiphosphate synthase [Agromyces sp. Root81]|uniref:bifunctional 2-C-methyl-D-erythritol 4-phosphate cytidylyltransferase/2-C-methyl-D-erythritol 2,4-cyclodiphosphate synthase n=1 Tax=Agromyces sp. Root81 TaxID=1736601 RepID=UPI0006FC5ACA|nr:bifunctional 2-C-methyl-D-erythritol 4-phosphate cytidylyltransferase/2-C-methyl-D-erythritol 2,4-cyclodiphosphate synthase [Agromyces sp. Root81]KRC60656.1 2-C-methyl-D-erythritol 2,4-cyclodiphosphate synthase [Agromyces sp. Root81]